MEIEIQIHISTTTNPNCTVKDTVKIVYTLSCNKLPRVKYLSLTIRVPISFWIASQWRDLSDGFRRLVITGTPSLKPFTFCFKRGTTLFGGRPNSRQNMCYWLKLCKSTTHLHLYLCLYLYSRSVSTDALGRPIYNAVHINCRYRFPATGDKQVV